MNRGMSLRRTLIAGLVMVVGLRISEASAADAWADTSGHQVSYVNVAPR
jgi:hypothetical protein